MDEKKLEELLVKNNQCLLKEIKKLEGRFDGLEGRFDGLEGRFDGLEGKFDGLESRFDILENKVDDNYRKLDEKIMDMGAYFEHKYGEQISAIWAKLQVMDERKDKDHQDIQELKKKLDHTNTILGVQDIRIKKLEEKLSS